MVWDIIRWYLVLAAIGVIGFPVVFGFVKKLPGRGFVFSRTIGLILISFIYWLAGTLGILQNNPGCLLAVIVFVSVLSFFCWKKQRDDIIAWIKGSKKYIILSEVIFLCAFALILSFRLGDPDVSGTEKPMEMMFINSILNSETFPPHDSWLSGYSISYYYFGYIMTAILVMLSGVLSSVGFNMMLATVFAMAAVSAFGIINDMLDIRDTEERSFPHIRPAALSAPVFILIIGNLEGFFELLHSLHLFWNPDGSSPFWQWVGLKELTEAPVRPASWDPTGRPGIWWWRASRVLSDTGLEGSVKEVIDEFPMFSFGLGDLHPHVLAIPFVLFAVGIALNALENKLNHEKPGLFFAEGLLRDDLSLRDTDMVKWILSADFLLTAICIGALLFLNMWDFPFYFGLYCLCVTAAYLRKCGWNRGGFTVFFETALPLGSACILLYSLFFMSFSSQAGGIALSGVFVTRPIQFLIMFGFFLFPVFWWLFKKLRSCGKPSRRFGLTSALVIFGGLSLLEVIIFSSLLLIRANNLTGALGMAAESFVSLQEISTIESGLLGFFSRRLNALPTLIILFSSAGSAFAMIRQTAEPAADNEPRTDHPVDVFCALMILIASALVIFPEFFYLRDLFGTRMNTIFKFYYQAWILFGLSAAYSCGELGKSLHGLKKAVFSSIMILLLGMVMIYPFFITSGKWESLRRKQTPTLDGSAYLRNSRKDDWEGVQWLKKAAPGNVLEKVGASYSGDNIVSTFAGIPAVLGPVGHESQWRGGYKEIGSRNDDVKRIYETHSWETTKELLETYKIRYVFIGSAEKSAYNIQEKKFERNLNKVYQSGICTIYQVY